MTSSDPSSTITSSFRHDQDMIELIGMFVDELPDRVAAVNEAYETENWSILRTLSHQLKGAAPGYGFEPVGLAAGEVERLLKNAPAADELRDAVESLLAVCKRVAIA
jgi:HPt (histidine-containing phosphotransfer) domain-containing protein